HCGIFDCRDNAMPTPVKPLSFAAALACAGLLASAAVAQDAPKPELLAELPNAPGNLTVAPDGTVIISVHPSYPSDVIAYTVDTDGEVRPFPSAAASAGMSR